MSGRAVILVSGAVLLAAVLAVTRIDPRMSSGVFVGLMTVAAGGYVAARAVVGRATGSPALLLLAIGVGIAARVALIGSAPLVSDDVYRYVWDGRVQQAGYNPYAWAPDDSALEPLHTELTRRIDPVSAALPTIYPPAAELFFRAVTSVQESVGAMVAAVVLCDLLTMVVLWRWLGATGRSPWWVLVYAWHPLVVLEGAGGGHVDLVGTLLVVTAGHALSRRRGALASAALALAVAVKFLPLVLAPVLWGRVRPRDALIGVGVLAAVYGPFVDDAGLLPVGSLATYAESWRFNGPIFEHLEPWIGVRAGLALAVAAGLGTAMFARRRWTVDDPRSWGWPMAATLLLMPTVYPWYLVWLVPFLTGRGTGPLTAWTLTSIWTYVVWANQRSGVGWVLPGWVEPLEYGVVALVALGLWLRRSPRSPWGPPWNQRPSRSLSDQS